MEIVDAGAPLALCNLLLRSEVVKSLVDGTKCYMELFNGGVQQDCQNGKQDLYYTPEKFVGYQKGHFQKAINELNQSGFYYENFSNKEACDLLKDKEPGDFIVRESKSLDGFFTLTFKNKKDDIKHVRIGYSFGIFYLVTSKNNFISHTEITSESVVKLIELYLYKNIASNTKSLTKKIYLIKPLNRNVSTLKHICTVCINKQNDTGMLDNLPAALKDYTSNYPYKL